MNPLIALSDFRAVLPKIVVEQEETLRLLSEMHADRAALVRRYGVKSPRISTRRFESTDIEKTAKTIEDRALFFHERAREVFDEFYSHRQKAPSHLIHVTCTGYVAPSAAQEYVAQKEWSGVTGVSHAYHMGCYAAMPAIRIAEGLVAAAAARDENDFKVDIAHNEMCALHMNKENSSPEQLVVQSLFADGHIKYTASRAATVNRGFAVLSIREEIVPNSLQDMSWIPSDVGMRMTLSRDVPAKISETLRPFLSRLLLQSGDDLAATLKNATFAVHPGGPKIIDAVREILELRESQVERSVEVLRERGNMSSATLPHIWQRILESPDLTHGHRVVSLAFGPGLTIFGSVFDVIRRDA